MSHSEIKDEGFSVSIDIEPSSPMSRNVFINPTYGTDELTGESVSSGTGAFLGFQQAAASPAPTSARMLGFQTNLPTSRPVLSPLFGIPSTVSRLPVRLTQIPVPSAPL